MSNPDWTKRDAAMLKELQAKKAAWEEKNHRPVRFIAQDIQPLSTVNLVFEYLIKHADRIRDALAPFDSGVRPAKGQE